MAERVSFLLDQYLLAKDVICTRRTIQSTLHEQKRDAILQQELDALVEQNPERALRLYPFDHMARENAQKRHDFQAEETILSIYWAFYFTARADLLDRTTQSLRRSRMGKIAAFFLESTESLGAHVGRLTDPLMDRGWTMYRDNRPTSQPT
jgi:hypothetical protein